MTSSIKDTTVTDAMIEAGVAAFGQHETLSVRRLLEVAYPAMRSMEAKPDPEGLREAGEELADKLWILRCDSRDTLAREAADKALAMWTAALTAKPSLEPTRTELVEALQGIERIAEKHTGISGARSLQTAMHAISYAARSILSRKQSGGGSNA